MPAEEGTDGHDFWANPKKRLKKDARYVLRKEVKNVNGETQVIQPSVPATKLKEITYIPVVQAAKVFGVIAAIIFFIYGLFVALGVGASLSSIPGVSGFSGVFAAIAIIILMPIFGFIVGFIGTAIEVFIYNLIVPRIGGIQVQVK